MGHFLLCLILLCVMYNVQGINLFPGEDWNTGFISVEGDVKALHYHLFRCRNKSLTHVPLLVWLDGGPGYSSAFGVYEHGGPYILNNKTGEVEWNKFAWNNFTNTLFVDQPAGTLFSYTRSASAFCHNESCVSKDFYTFLLSFYQLYPEFKDCDLYICGVSYGGHYAPAIAAHIMRKKNKDIHLKGLAIYNGLTDLYVQFSTCATYLYENKLIGTLYLAFAKSLMLVCQVAHFTNSPYVTPLCNPVGFLVFALSGLALDPYDIQQNAAPNPYEVGLTAYLNRPEVQEAMHVNQTFTPTNFSVFLALEKDYTESYASDVSYVLQQGLKVNLVFGDKDYICNWMGGEALAESFEWAGQREFKKKNYVEWQVRDTAGGSVKEHDNLSYVVVHGAGHSVFAKARVFGSEVLKRFLGVN